MIRVERWDLFLRRRRRREDWVGILGIPGDPVRGVLGI